MSKIIAETPHRRRPSGHVLFFVAFSLVNVANFGFHMVISRQLTPSEYGALGALLGIMLVMQVPVGALQVAITQQVARHLSQSEDDSLRPLSIGHLLGTVVAVAFVAGVFVAACSPLIKAFLHLQSVLPALLLAVYVLPMLIGLVPRAVLIGEQRLGPVGVALAMGAAFRLIAGFAFGQAGKGIEGAMSATVLADLLAVTIMLLYVRHSVSHEPQTHVLSIRLSDAAAAGIAFAGVWSLVGADTVLARHFMSGEQSGYYVAAATAARSALFLSGAVAVIVFPRFVEAGGRGPVARRILVQSVSFVAALGLIAALVMSVFSKLVVSLLFGSQYTPATGVISALSISAAFLGVITILVYFHLARRSPWAAICWVGVFIMAVGITLFHSSMTAVATVVLSTTLAMTLIALVAAFRPTLEEEPIERLAGRPADLSTDAELDVTVVIPFYNPGERFIPTLDKLTGVLQQAQMTFEVIAVSDGSTDGSTEALQNLNNDLIECVVFPENRGKGSALRAGLSLGRGRYIGFIDADGDLDPTTIGRFLADIQVCQPDIILGSKRHSESSVVYPPLRRAYSWGYQQLIRHLFHLNVRDTQTGIKFVRRDVLAAVLPRMCERRFAFDLELLVVARHLGYRRLFEAPVQLGTRFTSTVNMSVVLNMFLDTLGIFYRLQILGSYDEDAPIPTDRAEVVRRDGKAVLDLNAMAGWHREAVI